ncbi:MAG: hypothetical protein M3O15_05475, partial [Acidobacteriota bacterium]|nr:hypothetical protein [Acidobacteriota bacterium]
MIDLPAPRPSPRPSKPILSWLSFGVSAVIGLLTLYWLLVPLPSADQVHKYIEYTSLKKSLTERLRPSVSSIADVSVHPLNPIADLRLIMKLQDKGNRSVTRYV